MFVMESVPPTVISACLENKNVITVVEQVLEMLFRRVAVVVMVQDKFNVYIATDTVRKNANDVMDQEK